MCSLYARLFSAEANEGNGRLLLYLSRSQPSGSRTSEVMEPSTLLVAIAADTLQMLAGMSGARSSAREALDRSRL